MVRLHPWFGIDAQGVGDAIDVVEVADDLHGDGDGIIGEAVGSEDVEVSGCHLRGSECELDGEVAQGAVFIIEARCAVVKDELVGDIGFAGLPPEVLCVGECSVVAAVDGADDGGEHLALTWRKGVVRFHECRVEAHRTHRRTRVEPHDADNVCNIARSLHGAVVEGFDATGGIFGIDGFDVSHVD